jgi:hypothetical protein
MYQEAIVWVFLFLISDASFGGGSGLWLKKKPNLVLKFWLASGVPKLF